MLNQGLMSGQNTEVTVVIFRKERNLQNRKLVANRSPFFPVQSPNVNCREMWDCQCFLTRHAFCSNFLKYEIIPATGDRRGRGSIWMDHKKRSMFRYYKRICCHFTGTELKITHFPNMFNLNQPMKSVPNRPPGWRHWWAPPPAVRTWSPHQFAPGLIPVNSHANAFSMDGRAPVGGNPATVLSGLAEFCVYSASTCLSQDADTHCVSVGLGFLSALSLLLSFFLWVTSESIRMIQIHQNSN